MNTNMTRRYQIILLFIVSFVFFVQENQVLGNSIDDEQEVRQRRHPTQTTTTATHAGEEHAASAIEDGESSLLDLFGESAKEFLTHHLIPTTDASCRWNWKNFRCESHCDCAFQPTWGDYHVGRSCRKRREPLPMDHLEVCHLPPEDNPLHHIRMAMRKLHFDLNGKMTLIKGEMTLIRGEVCESWLSSAVEEENSDENGDGGQRLPPHDEAVNRNLMGGDGGLLSKPIRKLRKVFKCDSGHSEVGA